MAKTVYLDLFSGASGDMMLGALLDLGLPVEALRSALGSLAIDYGTIGADRVLRAGVSATKFRLTGAGDPHRHEHAHEHEHTHEHAHEAHGHAHSHAHAHSHSHRHSHSHAHDDAHTDAGAGGTQTHGHDHGQGHDHDHDHVHDRDRAHDHDRGHAHAHAPGHGHHSLADIAKYIDRSALSAAGKARAREMFQRLAEAEAAVHAMPVERVHLHEVGAVDSIIDIVGAVYGMEWLGATEIVASPVNVGSGTVRCAHGLFPVPAPATARLLQGVPVYAGPVAKEMTTPTGALLVTSYAQRFGPMPPMTLTAIGYGAGDRDFACHPNVLRLMVGEPAGAGPAERIVSIQCEIDDMNPQLFGPLMDRLLAAGALDVYYAPVQMKKNRPGTLVTVLAAPGGREAISGVLFTDTTTIGVRYQEMERERLERETRRVQTPVGAIRFKIARRAGTIVNAAPEFDDCAAAAASRGLPIKDVQAIAMKAWLESLPDQHA